MEEAGDGDPEREHAEFGPAGADIVMTCAESAAVDAIHCEKPMAGTWADCREMVERCEASGTQLTFNHQRRFAKPFREAKTILDEGEIGALDRVEIGGPNLYDYGSHLFDICGYYTDQADPEWVLGQVEYRESNVQFGMHNENQGLARWRYENGVDGFASTGDDGIVDCQVRLVGASGVIEVGAEDGPPLRVCSDGRDWRTVDTGQDDIHEVSAGLPALAADAVLERIPKLPDQYFEDPSFIDRAIEDVIESLRTGSEPETAARNALQSTEIIFAIWESARRTDRVDLPLEIDDNPLESMVEGGTVAPQ